MNQRFNSPEELIQALTNKEMIILLDDESRENEGDFVMPAENITPDSINFMITQGRGLVCLAMTPKQARQLKLPLQRSKDHHQAALGTAFTLSIEARTGVTTGISAYDRARTIQVAANPESQPQDIVVPGHIFPLVACTEGLLKRPGHTEASVHLAALSGHSPSAVICEILSSNGEMARRDELLGLAAKFSLKIGTVESLVTYFKTHNLSSALC